jgi:hypothetical protein
MKKPSTLDQEVADLKLSELPSIQRVQAKQERMLRLLKRSQADRVSYAGLEYCTAEYCGRVNCSEACWFGTLRRRVRQVQAIRLLMEEFDPPLHKIIAWKPDWGCPYGWLHYIKPRIAKALMTASSTACAAYRLPPSALLRSCHLGRLRIDILWKFT